MNPKFPKKMSLEEWYELIKDSSNDWSEQLAVIDAEVRQSLFSPVDGLSTDLMLLSAFFYSAYLNHWITSLVTDSRVGIPADLLAQYTEIAQEVAEKSIEEAFGKQNTPLDIDLMDPEDRITMRGGDA